MSRRAWIAIAAAALVVVAWDVVALQLGAHTFFGASSNSVFNRLADAFRHGHTNLDVKLPKGLLGLPNPYDPVANRPYRVAGLHDLSIYHGKVYAYWGPVPAVLVYLPARLAGVVPADGHVVLLFVLGSFAAMTATLLVLVRRHLPAAPPAALFAAVLALGFANLGPFLLSRPLQYEVAIAAGDFFLWLGVLCFVLALRASRPRLALAAGSLAFGLAAGCRPTLVFAALMAAVVAWPLWAAERERRARGSLLAALALPCAAVLAVLAAYNHARFGSWTEFGTRWQLSDPQFRNGGYFTAGAVLPNIWNYLLPPPLVRAAFPFLYGNPAETSPIGVPSRFVHDAVVGLLWYAPLTLLAPLAPRWLRAAGRDARRTLAMLAIGFVAVALPILLVRSAANRYEADFLPLAVLVAALGLGARVGAGRSRGLAVAGVALAVLGALVTALVSLDNDRVLRSFHQGALRSLESATAPVSALASGLAGHPIVASVDGIADGPPYRYDRLGREGASLELGPDGAVVEIAASHSGEAELRTRPGGGGFRVPGGPAAGPGGVVAVHVRRGVTRLKLVPDGPGRVRLEDLRARWR